MNKLKNSVCRGFLCLMCLFLLMGALPLQAAPSPMDLPQKIFLERYELTDERIVPGNPFTLKLFFKNTAEQDAKDIIVDAIYPVGVMPVYGTVSQAVVDIPTGETAEVDFSYNTLDRIGAPVLDFQIVIRENTQQYNTLLRTPVGLNSPFDVIATFVPDRAMAGENVNCSITFKYLGVDPAENICARMDVGGKTVHTAEIGTVSKENTKTQGLFCQFEEPGSYVVELYLDYSDEAGNEKSVIVGTYVLDVQENQAPAAPQGNLKQGSQDPSADQTGGRFQDPEVLILSVSLIAVLLVVILFLLRKKK